jgi:tRNA (adenine57-N1/adenine58-N1)-methyltransferase
MVTNAQAGEIALLISPKRKEFMVHLQPGQRLQTHRGVLEHDNLIGMAWGSTVLSHTGDAFLVLQPTLRDVLLHTKRRSQIMYPKEIGYVLLRLSIGPGSNVLEAGTGSGALTTAFAWAVGAEGKVYSYDRRADMQELAQRNLRRLGLLDRVQFHLADVESGFEQHEIESLFLDLPGAHHYLAQARAALRNGAVFGAILPTTNQVSLLLEALEPHGFGQPDVCEVMLRFYKPSAQRLRPTDRMVAHTGFLIFARAIAH